MAAASERGELRLVHVMECFTGGARRHLRDLCAGLARRGLEVHAVFSLKRDGSGSSYLEEMHAAGVKLHEIALERELRPRRDLRGARELVRLIRAIAPHCVHTHGSKAGVLGRLAARRAGVAVRVHTPHGFAHDKRSEFAPLRRWFFRALERRLARASTRLILLSEEERTRALAAGFEAGKLAIIANGVSIPAAEDLQPRERARADLGLEGEGLLLLCAGLFMPEKGQGDLLRALALLGARARLLLAGSGPLQPYLEALAGELRLGGRVRFMGQRDDIPRLIDACDLLVLPSRSEALPYIALEALARCRPVLATRVGALGALIRPGYNGWLCPPAQVAELAAALAALLDAPAALAAAGGNGPRSLGREHRLETMIEHHRALYEELVRGVHSGGTP